MSAVAPPDLAEALLEEAIASRASDIHLHPSAGGWDVRLRVDGRFVPAGRLDGLDGQRLIGRLKVLASLMVYRSDIPQEGRIPLPRGREGRLAVIPTPNGEKATVRLFDPEANLDTLDALGYSPAVLEWLRARLARPSGLFLVVGPSGSGKTTTLYAALKEILARRGEFSEIVTVEDPIERHLERCVQVQVDPIRDLDFAAALKFLLRQDPEVIMVGEIRDAETARIAVRAAMTGHLVLSSLHCGRAAEARPRLLEMGAEPYAVDLALSGVIAQRLVRRVCMACTGTGCPQCHESGYRGRVVVAETLDAGTAALEGALEDAARALVDAGATTQAEVGRVIGARS